MIDPLAISAISALLIGLSAVLGKLGGGGWVSPPSLLATSLLFPIILFSIDLRMPVYLVFWVAVVFFSTAYASVSLVGAEAKRPASLYSYDHRKIVIAIWVLFVVCEVAFLFNLARVVMQLGIDAYWTKTSKDIELTFGSITAVNYAFFLGVPAAVLICFGVAQRIISRAYLVLACFFCVQLLFTGIKSTFIFGSLVVFFSAQVSGLVSFGRSILFGLVFVLVSLVLFLVVNIGFDRIADERDYSVLFELLYEILKGYIYNNYLNFELEFLYREEWGGGKFTFFFITKFLNPGVSGYYDLADFYLVDPDYNMGTFLREYFADYGVVGCFLIPAILGVLSSYARVGFLCENDWRAGVLYSVFCTAAAFAFFGNQFIRLQFIWFFLVMCFVFIYVSNGRVLR